MIKKFIIKLKSTNIHFLFVCCWIFVSILFQFHKSSFYPPISVHQGAQADRASIAYNFYSSEMNILLPRVMETGTLDGITPSEFPLTSYIAAGIYKIFGFHEFWYRFTVWCFMGLGLWAAINIFSTLGLEKFKSLTIVFCWYFSTVLCYYTNNFLPDVVSLSFVLLALWQWFLLKKNDKPTSKILFTVFATLACLIKITSAVFIIALLLNEIYFFITKKNKPSAFAGYFIAFVFTFSWYYYCKILEKSVGGTYFLMNIEFPKNFKEFKEFSEIFFNNWFTKIYNIPQWLFVLTGLLALPFVKIQNFLKSFILISFVGCVGFYLLMAKQFRYHDYYIITLLPCSLLLFYSGYKILEQTTQKISTIVIFTICIWGMIDAKNGVRLRYSPGNYWYQTFFEPEKFEGTNEWLNNNGISQKQKILAAFDANPNVLLYMLKRRGYRAFDHSERYIMEKIKLTSGLVINDTSKFFRMYPSMRYKLDLKSEYNELKLYKSKNGN